MTTLKVENSFELKLNRTNTINHYRKLIEELPKFERTILITYYLSNDNYKKNIITLENPKIQLKNHLLNNERFFISIKKQLVENSLKKVQVEICK